MAIFAAAYAKTAEREGGYSFHSHDPGGETFGGVCRRDHPGWAGWAIIDERKARGGDWQAGLHESLDVLVAQVFRSYWDAVRGDAIRDQAIANALFDTAILMGPGAAILMLQQGLAVLNRGGTELVVDGQCGPQTLATLAALNDADCRTLGRIIRALRGARVTSIALKRPDSRAFIRGWINRIEATVA